jgi:dTDP-glucose 4,6-dehydratase
MKVLLFGGLGVVGSQLATQLAAMGHEVWVADKGHSHLGNYVRCDISEFRQCERIFEQHKDKPFDYVYQLAAEFGRWNGEDYYETLWKTNAIGNKNVVRCQEKYKFRCVYFSSSEIYGDYEDVMYESVADTVPLRQMNDYAMSKWVNEMQVLNSATRYGTESVRVRLFNTYGPGEWYHPYRSVLCVFVYKAIHDMSYTVYRDYWRTSLYIEDCAKTLANITTNFKPGEVYNISGTEYHNIETVSETILAYLKKDDSLVVYKDSEVLTTRYKKVNCDKAIRDLKHKTDIALVEGIKKTIDWAKVYYAREREHV